MAKIRETTGLGKRCVGFYVSEIHSLETATKWLETKCNLDIELYLLHIPGNFDDGRIRIHGKNI